MSRVRDVVDRLPARLAVRGGFLLFFIYLCWRLLAFRAWALGAGPFVPRPEAVAGLLPVGAFMSLFLWLKTGFFDPVLPAGIVIIVGALATSLLLKRGFCGWICPVGTVWEGAAWLGRKTLARDNYRAPRGIDRALRVLRWMVSGLVLGFIALVPVAEAMAFQQLPYYAVVDAKMVLLFGAPLYLAVIALAFVGMMLFGNVWCRYLCPLGGLYGAVGSASVCAVVRDERRCVRCGLCAEACHAAVPVDRLATVRHAECDGCMDCVRVCPAGGALTARAFGRVRFAWWVWPLAVVGVWLVVYAIARATGHWETGVPIEAFREYFRIPGL